MIIHVLQYLVSPSHTINDAPAHPFSSLKPCQVKAAYEIIAATLDILVVLNALYELMLHIAISYHSKLQWLHVERTR